MFNPETTYKDEDYRVEILPEDYPTERCNRLCRLELYRPALRNNRNCNLCLVW